MKKQAKKTRSSAKKNSKKNQKTRIGIVKSCKCNNTVLVEVERSKKHPQYRKYYKIHNRFMVHDENEKCKKGDRVIIVESKPYSKKKCWTVIKKIKSESPSE